MAATAEKKKALPRVSGGTMTEDEAKAIFDGQGPEIPEASGTIDAEGSEGKPEWADIPEGLKLPIGESIAFIRIPGKWLRGKGDRVCIVWPITELEERTAYARARGDSVRAVSELSKVCIRAIDGVKADWTGDASHPGNVNKFWDAIGPRGRLMIRNYYVQTHTVNTEDQADFFVNHFCVMTAGG